MSQNNLGTFGWIWSLNGLASVSGAVAVAVASCVNVNNTPAWYVGIVTTGACTAASAALD